MDTRFLESFISVIENGSMAEAARQLNLTSAAIALRIRILEAEIGTRLLIRSGRSVRPTEAGAAILSRARDVLNYVRDLKSIATADTVAGELRIGVVQTALSGLLPPVLTAMERDYPAIAVQIKRSGSAELYPQVLSGDLDAAIIAKPPFAIPKTCNWYLLRTERLVLLTLASLPKRNPRVILSSEPFIRQDRKSWAGRLIDGYLRRARIRPHERFELDSYESIAVMVGNGRGVALVHDWAPPWPEGLSLRKIPVAADRFNREIGILWMRSSPRDRLVRAFLEARESAERRRSAVPLKPKRKGSESRV
jgi:DNA-binding transcriptional LysR family regulator